MSQIEVQKVQEVQGVQIRLIRGREKEPILRRTALQAEAWWVIYTEGVAPGYYLVVPSRHQSAYGV